MTPNVDDLLTRSNLLRSKASAFCKAFLKSVPPTEMLDTFFTTNPQIHEHGPSWAISELPFLGITFSGRQTSNSPSSLNSLIPTCDDYFSRLASTLSFHPSQDTFPPDEEFVVDTKASAVSVVAKARFESVKTGVGWDEEFMYKLSGFDEEGRIGRWDVWADPLSAWVAVREEVKRP